MWRGACPGLPTCTSAMHPFATSPRVCTSRPAPAPCVCGSLTQVGQQRAHGGAGMRGTAPAHSSRACSKSDQNSSPIQAAEGESVAAVVTGGAHYTPSLLNTSKRLAAAGGVGWGGVVVDYVSVSSSLACFSGGAEKLKAQS